jgi:peptidoglycan/LPS O-acetylase OafA/YrhL
LTTVVSSSAPVAAPGTETHRAPRLLSVDALRAIAALSVLLHHMAPVSGPLVFLRPLQAMGFTGVGLFLVLSGFSIHYRWASIRHEGTFNQREFWRRRFRRLYPTYAAAALLTLVVGAITVGIDIPHWQFGGATVPAAIYVAAQVVLFPTNAVPVPLLGSVVWSLGLEIQLYAVYALVVKFAKRFDPVTVVAWSLAVTLIWRLSAQAVTSSTPVGGFLHHSYTTSESRFFYQQMPARCFEWFLGLLAAEAYFDRVRLPRLSRNLLLALALLIVGGILERHPVGLLHLNGNPFKVSDVTFDPLLGVAFFIILNWAIRAERNMDLSAVSGRALRALAYVGLFSYSIYLIHPIVLGAWDKTIGHRGTLALSAAGVFAVVVAWVFYLLIERRFLRRS